MLPEPLKAEFQNFLNSSNYYSPSDVENIAIWILKNIPVTKTKKIEYFECPCSFDIESTSFYDGKEKRANMYVWTIGLFGKVIVGRTWDEFVTSLNTISFVLGLSPLRRLLIYVHFLDFDFQFFRKWLEWDKVFSTDERKPLYAITQTGIEFRCSFRLSGYGLETVGKQLRSYHVEKLVGDLDYALKRHSRTPITSKEMGYITNDSRVVMAYIMECMDDEGTITKIPLTKTGYVRREIRGQTIGADSTDKEMYRGIIKTLRLRSDEYYQLKRGFQGGFTHGSPFYIDKTVEDCDLASKDICSSYPKEMVMRQMPMSTAQIIPIRSMAQFRENLSKYCCLFDIEFFDIESTFPFEHYLSYSRCYKVEGEVLSNGRIVKAKHLITTLTEIDYQIIAKTYRWKGNPHIGRFRRYTKGYLPTDFVKAVLRLYELKTKYKDDPEHAEEYQKIKELLNSAYGMCVTDPIRDIIQYNNNMWKSEYDKTPKQKILPESKVIEQVKKYNSNFGRFNFYAWGVWITAGARLALWTAIIHLKDDYIYSDTDSVKYRHKAEHEAFFEEFNRVVQNDLEKACAYHGIDKSMINPLTYKGKHKHLGFWEDDGQYKRFKTLGAKRYMYEKLNSGNITLTMAGVQKKDAMPYLLTEYGYDGVFDAFTTSLDIPGEYTGKNTHTYIDDSYYAVLVDYTGIADFVHERSYIHLEPAPYSLKISRRFIEWCRGLQLEYR